MGPKARAKAAAAAAKRGVALRVSTPVTPKQAQLNRPLHERKMGPKARAVYPPVEPNLVLRRQGPKARAAHNAAKIKRVVRNAVKAIEAAAKPENRPRQAVIRVTEEPITTEPGRRAGLRSTETPRQVEMRAGVPIEMLEARRLPPRGMRAGVPIEMLEARRLPPRVTRLPVVRVDEKVVERARARSGDSDEEMDEIEIDVPEHALTQAGRNLKAAFIDTPAIVAGAAGRAIGSMWPSGDPHGDPGERYGMKDPVTGMRVVDDADDWHSKYGF